VRGARIAEIESDLWEHGREAEEAGVGASDAGLQIRPVPCRGAVRPRVALGRGTPSEGGQEEGTDERDVPRSWWLVPAALVGLFDVLLFLGQLTGSMPEPRVGVQLAVSALWLLFAVCLWAGIALRNRRPQRAGWLVIVGCLPAIMVWWMVVPVLLAAATIVGAIIHMTTTPTPTQIAA
jgi:hypothetical protein